MLAPYSAKNNHLLAALPAEDYARLLPDLEFVTMPLGWVIYESGAELEYLYFPTSGIVSLLYVTENGESEEIANTGNEGLVGITLFMGGETTPRRAVVQSAGNGYRLKASILKREFTRGGALQYLALRFTQALITQITQKAACNRHHTIEQQMCRWLLSTLDHLPGNEVIMTQQQIANMLSVGRERVGEIAGKLQKAGLIHYSRARITVLDRLKLEECVCECYEVVKKEYDRLLTYTVPRGRGNKRELENRQSPP